MKIWILRLDLNKYPWISLEDRSNLLKKTSIYNSNRLSDGWQPVRIKEISAGATGANALGGDLPPLIDKKVVAAIQDLLTDAVEILPTEYVGEDYPSDNFYILNVIESLDCFDYEKSVFETFESGGILWVNKYSFLPDIVAGKHIFLVKNRGDRIFISDELKTRIDENDLKGFSFELAWDSEDEEAAERAAQEERRKRDERFQRYLHMKKGEIESLEDDEVIMAAMIWMQGNILSESKSIYDAIAHLPQICQLVFAMYSVKWDVENGGFEQFYDNNGLEIGRLAACGFAEIGLDDLSEIVMETIKIMEELPQRNVQKLEDFMDSYTENALHTQGMYFSNRLSLNKLDGISIDLIKQNAEMFGD